MHNPANDNNQRPAEFDRQLARAYPKLVVRASHYTQFPVDLANETVVIACRRWGSFRQTPGNPYFGFYTWLQWVMKAASSDWKRKRNRRIEFIAMEFAPERATDPAQESSYDIGAALAVLDGRGREVILRRAAGDMLIEIANDWGVSKQRVSQVENAARAKVLVSAGMVAANDNAKAA